MVFGLEFGKIIYGVPRFLIIYMYIYIHLYQHVIMYPSKHSPKILVACPWKCTIRVSGEPSFAAQRTTKQPISKLKKNRLKSVSCTHRIHVWYANIGGILMVNVTIYGIHGSYGVWEEVLATRDEMILILENSSTTFPIQEARRNVSLSGYWTWRTGTSPFF